MTLNLYTQDLIGWNSHAVDSYWLLLAHVTSAEVVDWLTLGHVTNAEVADWLTLGHVTNAEVADWLSRDPPAAVCSKHSQFATVYTDMDNVNPGYL